MHFEESGQGWTAVVPFTLFLCAFLFVLRFAGDVFAPGGTGGMGGEACDGERLCDPPTQVEGWLRQQ